MDELKRIDTEINTIIYDLARRLKCSPNITSEKRAEMVRQANGIAGVVTSANIGNVNNAVDLLINNYSSENYVDSKSQLEDLRRLRAWMDVLYFDVCRYNSDFCSNPPYESNSNEVIEINKENEEKLMSCQF